MEIRNRSLIPAALGILSIARPGGGQALFAVFDLEDLGASYATVTFALDESGRTVVGGSYETIDFFVPVAWIDGDVFGLGTLGGDYGEAKGLNDVGEIVGWSNLPGGTFLDNRAFLWRDGEMIDLGTFGGYESEAFAINEQSQIVGWAELEDDVTRRAFLWED